MTQINLWIALFCLLTATSIYSQTRPPGEYLGYERETMRGFPTGKLGEPILNPSYLNLPRAKAPGWGISGPGVSAEWTQGGESEWNSAAASADETRAAIYQDLEVPRAGQYVLWVRYAGWANKTENFTVTIAQDGSEVFSHEFGAKDVVDPHDEISMYWDWAFTWDRASASLKKGPARVSILIEKPTEARRHLDSFLLTDDLECNPSAQRQPDFAAARYLRSWSADRKPLVSLLSNDDPLTVPEKWINPKGVGRDLIVT